MVSYLASGRSIAARSFLENASRSAQIVISAITEGEIRFGLAKRPGALRSRAVMEDFLSLALVMPWDSSAARAYGSLRSTLERRGQTLGTLDLVIAAHAIALGATLITHDKAVHRAGDLLPVEDWATDL